MQADGNSLTPKHSNISLDEEQDIPLIGIGIAAIDYLAVVDPYPGVNDKIEAIESSVQGGGPVATAVAASSCLGVRSVLMTVLGRDTESAFVITNLEKFGVNTDFIKRDSGIRTPRAFIWVEASSGHRTVVLDRLKGRYIKPEDLNLDRIRNCRVLLVDGKGFPAMELALKTAKSAGVVTVMDAGHVRDNMQDLLALTDILICSQTFSENYTHCSDPQKALDILKTQYTGKIIITLGNKGSIAWDGQKQYIEKALSVSVKDTTGAGDVFHGAFCAALAGCCGTEDFGFCLHFASVAAGLSCRNLGGRAGLPTLSDVKNWL